MVDVSKVEMENVCEKEIQLEPLAYFSKKLLIPWEKEKAINVSSCPPCPHLKIFDTILEEVISLWLSNAFARYRRKSFDTACSVYVIFRGEGDVTHFAPAPPVELKFEIEQT